MGFSSLALRFSLYFSRSRLMVQCLDLAMSEDDLTNKRPLRPQRRYDDIRYHHPPTLLHLP